MWVTAEVVSHHLPWGVHTFLVEGARGTLLLDGAGDLLAEAVGSTVVGDGARGTSVFQGARGGVVWVRGSGSGVGRDGGLLVGHGFAFGVLPEWAGGMSGIAPVRPYGDAQRGVAQRPERLPPGFVAITRNSASSRPGGFRP